MGDHHFIKVWETITLINVFEIITHIKMWETNLLMKVKETISFAL